MCCVLVFWLFVFVLCVVWCGGGLWLSMLSYVCGGLRTCYCWTPGRDIMPAIPNMLPYHILGNTLGRSGLLSGWDKGGGAQWGEEASDLHREVRQAQEGSQESQRYSPHDHRRHRHESHFPSGPARESQQAHAKGDSNEVGQAHRKRFQSILGGKFIAGRGQIWGVRGLFAKRVHYRVWKYPSRSPISSPRPQRFTKKALWSRRPFNLGPHNSFTHAMRLRRQPKAWGALEWCKGGHGGHCG